MSTYQPPTPAEPAPVEPKTGNIAQRHPAEIGGPVATAVATLIAAALGADTSLIVPIAIVASFVPAAITWLVLTIKS